MRLTDDAVRDVGRPNAPSAGDTTPPTGNSAPGDRSDDNSGSVGANAPSDAMGTGAEDDSGDRSVTDADDEGNALEDNGEPETKQDAANDTALRTDAADAGSVHRLK